MKRYLMIALLLTLFTSRGAAQDEELGKNEFTVWGGLSPDSTVLIGKTPDTRFGIVALRYSRRFNNNDAVNLKYTADFVPFAALNYPDFEVVRTGAGTFRVDNVRPTRRSYGIAPFGLQVNFSPRKKLQPFVGTSGGFLYFNKRTPNRTGTRFNFTAEVGGGLEFGMTGKRSLTVGYKYYHISNAYRGIDNPGYDNNLFYIGYTFFSK
jgi:opacity protein-like surface antigen